MLTQLGLSCSLAYEGTRYQYVLGLNNMPTLYEVCVWNGFSIDSIEYGVDTTGSPNVIFNPDCATSVFEERIPLNSIIYPNPTNSLLTIETYKSEKHTIEIFTLSGQKIFSTEMKGSQKQIEMSKYKNGVYFVRIRSGGFVRTEKVIKM